MSKYTFNDTAYLISISDLRYDEDLNPIEDEIKKEVFCNIKSISKNEFYEAGRKDLQLSYVITIHSFEYEDERYVEFNGKKYEILRSYLNKDLIELTVGEKIG